MREPRPLVAVVDDEESVRVALARVLRGASYEVATFGSGPEFLLSLQTCLPECVVLDFQMPEMTGREVQQALRHATFQIPVIILTAHDYPQLREACLAEGAADYFVKPLRRRLLLGAVGAAIRNTRSR